MKLKRELGLFSTTLYGIGIILGAGIYALIGVGAGLSGNMLWLAFLVSAVIAIFTGISYAELSSRFPKEAAEYHYTKEAFHKELFSFVIGWILVIGTIIAASTVSLGFAGYFTDLFGGDLKVIALGLIVVMGVLNYLGIRESANFNNFASITEVIGLLIVVFAVFFFPIPQHLDVDIFEFPETGFGGIMVAVSVIFFAYIGFENVANLAEEVKDSKNVLPKALLLALLISTILYILVSVAAVKEVGWESLSESAAPLTLVVSRTLGEYSIILSVIALFATANTVLIFLIVSSRILYGMSHSGSLPKKFSHISPRGTPHFSVIIVAVVAALVAYAGDIKTIAQLTDLGIFIAYFCVNIALIALATRKAPKDSFQSPRFRGIPILAYLGALSALLMLFYFDLTLWVLELVVVLVGIIVFLISQKRD